MANLKLIFRNHITFFTGFIILAAFASFICIYYTKAEGFYLLNPYHTKWLDESLFYFTFLGDGFFCIAVGLIFLFVQTRKRLALSIFASYALSGIIAQVLKYFIVEPRPAVFLKDSTYKYFIESVTLHNYHSFPSGHTASAFALATVLAFYYKNNFTGLLLLLLATGVGYSRMYLGNHFMIDVLGGAVIGVVSGIICKLIWPGDLSQKKLATF